MDIKNYSNSNSSTFNETYGRINEKNVETFEISSSNLENFLKDYCGFCVKDEITEESNEETIDFNFSKLGGNLCEMIKTKKTIPLIINMIFKFESDCNEKKLYEDTLFPKIVKILQEIIKQNFNLTEGKCELLCCLLESKIWKLGDFKYKNIKIQFPNIQVDIKYQQKIIKQEFISLFRKNKIIKSFEEMPCGDIEEFIFDVKN
jgi:hypothetical protein